MVNQNGINEQRIKVSMDIISQCSCVVGNHNIQDHIYVTLISQYHYWWWMQKPRILYSKKRKVFSH